MTSQLTLARIREIAPDLTAAQREQIVSFRKATDYIWIPVQAAWAASDRYKQGTHTMVTAKRDIPDVGTCYLLLSAPKKEKAQYGLV